MITLTINGKQQRFNGDPDMPLLWVLRDELNLKGTKITDNGTIYLPVSAVTFSGTIRAVLELAGGRAAEIGLAPGDRVVHGIFAP